MPDYKSCVLCSHPQHMLSLYLLTPYKLPSVAMIMVHNFVQLAPLDSLYICPSQPSYLFPSVSNTLPWQLTRLGL